MLFDMDSRSYETWKNDHYLNQRQLEYFREKLCRYRKELETANHKKYRLINESDNQPIEEMERSALAFDKEIEIRNHARNLNLIKRIDNALERISLGTYGYCEVTEEPIGFDRLDANPVATFSFDVQNHIEMVSQRAHRFYY